MTYDDLAHVFEMSRKEGCSVAECLARVDAVRRSGYRLSDDRIAEMRRRRLAGVSVKQLVFDFRVSKNTVSRHCRGIVPGAEPVAPPLPAAAERVLTETANEFGLSVDEVRCISVRPVGKVLVVRRAAALAMRDAGVSFPSIARALGRTDHTTAMSMVTVGRTDAVAARAAVAIAARVGMRPDAERRAA